MEYKEFFKRFMGASRRKHLPRQPSYVDRVKNRIRPQRTVYANPLRGRSYAVPEVAELPRDFIRLEPWEAEYLFILSSRAKQGIVETGRFCGGSTFVMACANDTVPIHSIDIAPQDDAQLSAHLKRTGIGDNINLIVGDSQKSKYDSIGAFDLLFIDGDHSYEGCTNDLENWYPELSMGGHVVLHDCYFGCQVQPSVIDFVERHKVEIVQTPYITASHWRYPVGSLTHFIKRGD